MDEQACIYVCIYACTCVRLCVRACIIARLVACICRANTLWYMCAPIIFQGNRKYAVAEIGVLFTLDHPNVVSYRCQNNVVIVVNNMFM